MSTTKPNDLRLPSQKWPCCELDTDNDGECPRHRHVPVSVCEGSTPENPCGPVTTADSDGNPLCAACSASLDRELLEDIAKLVGFDREKHDDLIDAVREALAVPAVAEGAAEWEAKYAKARQVIGELCEGKREWIMSIPARPDHDPDIVIDDALDTMRRALLHLVPRGGGEG